MEEHYISPQELYRQLESTQPPFVIDVRGDAEYAAGHIPGARHIPGDRLAERLDEVPRDRPIVAY
ncbi:MAG TPA: rhodanese-like domain-containing protein [Caldilineaceae bacterium]|nr:rhodanese-like domain-containing protein [Caldilineaceae bacterium]